MLQDWNCLSDQAQLLLSREALREALALVTAQAEALAAQIDTGLIPDHGGAEALRLLVSIAQIGGSDASGTA